MIVVASRTTTGSAPRSVESSIVVGTRCDDVALGLGRRRRVVGDGDRRADDPDPPAGAVGDADRRLVAIDRRAVDGQLCGAGAVGEADRVVPPVGVDRVGLFGEHVEEHDARSRRAAAANRRQHLAAVAVARDAAADGEVGERRVVVAERERRRVLCAGVDERSGLDAARAGRRRGRGARTDEVQRDRGGDRLGVDAGGDVDRVVARGVVDRVLDRVARLVRAVAGVDAGRRHEPGCGVRARGAQQDRDQHGREACRVLAHGSPTARSAGTYGGASGR